MNTFDEVMQEYLEMMSKAPEKCRTCERRHFIGCYGCDNNKYWENLRNKGVNNA